MINIIKAFTKLIPDLIAFIKNLVAGKLGDLKEQAEEEIKDKLGCE